LGLTQDELAFCVGIGKQSLSAIENGGAFKVHTLDNPVSALDVSEKYIMRGKT
jgi:DNA-binding XRE family transcriptional regulator